MIGYDGPIYMTHPTKAIAPILLEDFRKITTSREGDSNFFTSDNIKTCMKKSIAVNLHQRVQVYNTESPFSCPFVEYILFLFLYTCVCYVSTCYHITNT